MKLSRSHSSSIFGFILLLFIFIDPVSAQDQQQVDAGVPPPSF
ncbi:hypothetical protein [Aureitalea marina]|nr:hypothetical protein [Aureitalea marina]